jgi:hypothetical protein
MFKIDWNNFLMTTQESTSPIKTMYPRSHGSLSIVLFFTWTLLGLFVTHRNTFLQTEIKNLKQEPLQ